MVLSTLQRSIYAVALGKPTKPDFFTNGVPKNSLIEEVKLVSCVCVRVTATEAVY